MKADVRRSHGWEGVSMTRGRSPCLTQCHWKVLLGKNGDETSAQGFVCCSIVVWVARNPPQDAGPGASFEGPWPWCGSFLRLTQVHRTLKIQSSERHVLRVGIATTQHILLCTAPCSVSTYAMVSGLLLAALYVRIQLHTATFSPGFISFCVELHQVDLNPEQWSILVT